MSDKAKLTLVLEVDYKLNGTEKTVLMEQLEDVVHHAVSNGMVTGPTPAIVERYEYNVVDEEDTDG